ncbi:DNA polymerase IV [Paludicola sp. MB14-C6]|uniref:DNA polymerase IV n=1 Tax=Paludihabitans sp. MB14-C6 TaxID=3070656 RepID=UPI0027DCBA7B|nr:DNA polymerase IV [Paludicola sp. MB14-C6]WMJ23289.1 DNA polymerase IV [Paludicola sp. MB14-C6]
MDNIILHCDLNNFFASVELLNHPEFKTYPVAVCGNSEERHGIILAKNEVAKKFGVKTAEVIWQAKQKCPDLILLSPNMDKYISYSKQVRRIYENYTDLIEPFGIDECWLDVTGSTLLFGNGFEIATKIKEHVKSETGLTISVGVSFNKIFAKLGSDMKKPDAITEISKSNYQSLVWPLPVSELLGVGKATCSLFHKYGINTIGDLAKSELTFIQSALGKNGEALWYYANGICNSKVEHKDATSIPKSIGNSITCSEDLSNCEEVWKVMYCLTENVAKRLRKNHLLAGSVQISVKDTNLFTREFQAPLPFSTRHPKDISELGIHLFQKNYHWTEKVRAIGIRAIHLVPDDEYMQYSFSYDYNKISELEALEEKVCFLRDKYGNSAIQRASLLGAQKEPKEQKYDESSLPNKIK